MSDQDGNMNTILLVGLGFLAGAAIALVFAPASGDETRMKLGKLAQTAGKKAHDGMDAVQGYVQEGRSRLRDLANDAGSKAREGADSIEKVLIEGKDRLDGGIVASTGSHGANASR